MANSLTTKINVTIKQTLMARRAGGSRRKNRGRHNRQCQRNGTKGITARKHQGIAREVSLNGRHECPGDCVFHRDASEIIKKLLMLGGYGQPKPSPFQGKSLN